MRRTRSSALKEAAAAGQVNQQRHLRNITNSPKNDKPSVTKGPTPANQCVVKLAKIDLENLVTPSSEQRKNDVKSMAQRGEEGDLSPQALPDSLEQKLCKVISNKYVDAADRLKLEFPPKCASDVEYCHKHHYRSKAPTAPGFSQINHLRLAFEQANYVTYVKLALDMCQRCEFPGEKVFTQIIELIMSINPQKEDFDCLQYTYEQAIELFDIVLRKFPPCWIALRPAYFQFFHNSLDASKISPTRDIAKDVPIFKAVLYLLEVTLEERDDESSSLDTITDTYSPDVSLSSEYLTLHQWETQQINNQTFQALKKKSIKLERIFAALQLIVKILEYDMVMWILRHHKHPKLWIFSEQQRPLIVEVFNLTMYKQFNEATKSLMQLFAFCLSKDLKEQYLSTLERFVRLLAVVSNISELKYCQEKGVSYPQVGPTTKSFVREFFKNFAEHAQANVNSYLKAIDLLRIPFLRYEFIDLFLQNFYKSSIPKNSISPQKIAEEMNKLRWLKFQPQDIMGNNSDNISREQYLSLLLTALRDYCDCHGSKAYLNLVTNENKDAPASQNKNHSICSQPPGKEIDLKMMAKDIEMLENQMNMKVKLATEKVELTLVKICVDDSLLLKYRTDLKFVMILYNMISKQMTLQETANFTGWMEFLKEYIPH